MSIYIVLLIAAILVSSIGWIRYVYFISLGYGFSISACALAMAIFFRNSLTLPEGLLCLALFAYGCRLGGFLLYRQLKSKSYNKALKENVGETDAPTFVKFMIWISCSILYMTEVCPVANRLQNHSASLPVNTAWAWIALIVIVLGITLESAADWQKSKAKKVNPHRFVSTGLYRIVRCPNYLGEMVIWTGCFLASIRACCTWWQWVLSAIGYIGIIYVMFSGARRLEVRQNKNYGEDPEYQKYIKTTPILVPLIPLYSVEKYSWLKA